MSFSRTAALALTLLTGAARAGTPGIDLEVTVGTDLSDGACAAASTLDAIVGAEVNFCYRVTNNTATALEFQSLHDSIEGSLLSEQALSIAPGATVQYNRIRQLARSLGGTRTLTWTARDVRPDYTAAPRAGAFIDLSTRPTAVPLNPATDASDPTGAGMVQVDVPFTFDFYGVASNRLCVGMDGGAQVGTDRCILFPIAAGPLPQGGMGPAMLPLWDDFAGWSLCGDDCIDLFGAVYADTVGDAPNRRFVVEWYNVRHEAAGSNDDRATFELVIDEASGTISFEYADVEYTAIDNFFGAPDVCNGGVCAAIGLQQDDAWADSYAWDEVAVSDGSAIDWIVNAPATYAASASVTLDVGAPVAAPPASIAGSAAAGTSTSVTLTLANDGDRDLAWTLGQGTEPSSPAGAAVPAYVSRMLLADYPTMDNTLLGFDAAAPSAPAPVGTVHRIYDAGAFVDDDFSQEYLVSGWREIGGTHIFRTDILERVDTATAEITPVGDTGVGGSEYIAALAWDPTTSTLYAAITGYGGTTTLATIDRYDGSVTRLAPIEGPDVVMIIGLAIDARGEMFALDQNSLALMAVDKTTGVATPVGPIGEDVAIPLNGSLAFDRSGNVLYLIGATPDILGGDYIVDLASGHAELVGTIGADQELASALAIATPGGPCTNATPAPWLSFDPAAGTVGAGSSEAIAVGLDASGLAEGHYEADLCVRSNDPYRHTLPVHVTFDVGADSDTVFASGFDAP